MIFLASGAEEAKASFSKLLFQQIGSDKMLEMQAPSRDVEKSEHLPLIFHPCLYPPWCSCHGIMCSSNRSHYVHFTCPHTLDTVWASGRKNIYMFNKFLFSQTHTKLHLLQRSGPEPQAIQKPQAHVFFPNLDQ